ncbi:MAG: hypothetical protein ED559_01145 [Phycisphaera sp.]|nr:MAG: hypothetical protein ED559_01145 [Phycisphaera sp.]
MFAQDRDLLVYEPRLFLDVVWVGQRLVSETGTVASGVVVAAGADFAAAGVGAGHVLNFKEASYEVVQRLGSTQLAISVPRVSVDDPVILPPDSASTTVRVYTFAHQMQQVHDQILRMLGIEPEVDFAPGERRVTEESIVNPGALRRLEVFGTLHLVFSAASASGVGGETGTFADRAEMYRKRYQDERERVSALIDTDGDGVADATRRPSVTRFLRG